MSDFTFNEFHTGILKFNDENVMHIGFNSDTEDIIITNWNASADTAKTLQTNLNGGGGSAVLGQKTITVNGTYDASDDGLDGYDQVTVNVPAGANRETEILSGSLYGSYTNNDVTTLRPASLADCPAVTSVTMNALVSAGNNAFLNDTALESVTMPELTATGTGSFKGCTNLDNVSLPKLGVVNTSAFENCTGMTAASFPMAAEIKDSGLRNCRFSTIVLPSVTKASTYAISNNPNLTAADFSSLTQLNGGSCFINDSSLAVLVIRTSTMATCSNANHFNGTPMASDGAGGEIYVPSDLVSQYEIGTNWAALNVTFKAIEGSYYATHYVDGTVI